MNAKVVKVLYSSKKEIDIAQGLCNVYLLRLNCNREDYPSLIASLGQASAQEPQLMQVSGSIT